MRRFFIIWFLLLAPLAAQPQGHFLVGEHDGEDFVFNLTIKRSKLLLKSINSDMSGEAALTKVADGVYRFNLPVPGEEKLVNMIAVSNDEIVLTSPDEELALRGYRIRSVPKWLNGRWGVSDQKGRGLEFRGNEATLIKGESSKSARVYGLKPEGPVSRIVLINDDDSVLLHLIQIDNTMLIWDQDDGDVKRFHREGWMGG